MNRHIRITPLAEERERQEEILSPEALAFLTRLHDHFLVRRQEQLQARMDRRRAVANGRNLGFLPQTESIRTEPSWRVAGPGPGLEDRRVEITGPAERKMAVNALNSGAKVWLADMEDALSPRWDNILDGQLVLADAIRRRIDFTSAEGKEYRLKEQTATIVFRPRGWHLVEKHLRYTDAHGAEFPTSAALVDFGLYFFHNARELIERGTGPYFYLPKIESHVEARLWDDIFTFSENALGIPHGTIRATVLIETIPAAFEMEEILYELREHCAGLNAGRWDYLFSLIKNYGERGARFRLPDRSKITMTVPFLRAYTELMVATCHRRGAHAIGGMSAFIPDRRDPEVTERALQQVAADKRREAGDGFDGTWVAHPDLIPTARAEFDAVLGERPDQRDRLREDVAVTAEQLVDLTGLEDTVTDAGVRANVGIALRYIAAWLGGLGAVSIDSLMEDVATAEISRVQLWQWILQGCRTAEGTDVTREWVELLLQEALAAQPRRAGDWFDEAAEVVREVALAEELPAFLTVGAYSRHLVQEGVRTAAIRRVA